MMKILQKDPKNEPLNVSDCCVNKVLLAELPNHASYTGNRFFVHLPISECHLWVPFLLDTGSDITLLPQSFVSNYVPNCPDVTLPSPLKATTASASSLTITRTVKFTFLFETPTQEPVILEHVCFVSPDVSSPILGQDLLIRASPIIDYQQATIQLFDFSLPLFPQNACSQMPRTASVYTSHEYLIPPNSVCNAVTHVNTDTHIAQSLVTPIYPTKRSKPLTVTSCIIAEGSTANIQLPISNETDSPIHLP